MNQLARIISSISLMALAITSCNRSDELSVSAIEVDDELPKYVIEDGKELVVPTRGIIKDIETNIKLLFPKDYSSEIFKGLDFYVYYYHAPLNRGTIALYLGDHPNYKANPDNPELYPRKFGQLPTTFRKVKIDNGFIADALISSYFTQGMSDDERMATGILDERTLHIKITTNDENYLHEAFAILATAENQQ